MKLLSKKLNYLFVLSAFCISLSGCVSLLPEAHKIDIHQGNIIEQDRVSQLRAGMSKDQVKYLLGTPVNNNVFHSERWDYLHYVSKAGTHGTPERLTVYFENGTVSRIENASLD